jgi:hypothetical protein
LHQGELKELQETVRETKRELRLAKRSAVTVSFPAAAKVPHNNDEARADMADEVAALTAIGQHDNIVELYAWGYAPEKECDVLLMERAQGCLHSLIRWAEPPAAI